MKKINEKLKEKGFFEYKDNNNKIKIIGNLITDDLYLLKEIQVDHNFKLKNIRGLGEKLLKDLNQENALNKSWEILEQEDYKVEIVSETFNQNQEKYDAYKLIVKPDTYSLNQYNYDKNRDPKGEQDQILINKEKLESIIKTLLDNSKW